MPEGEESGPSQTEPPQQAKSWIPSVPAPIKQIFDKFPLLTYPPNKIPSLPSSSHNEHCLYLFSSPRASKQNAPSHNPQCLKWQSYLKFSGLKFQITPSNNHASPTGSLPFLLPASQSAGPTEPSQPIPSNKLQKWTEEQLGIEEEESAYMRFEAYSSLLDLRIRRAWLYTLYLDDSNFASIAHKHYVDSASSNPIVRMVIAKEIREAARNELMKPSPYVDVDDVMMEARNAFEALSVLLGADTYFFNKKRPGIFDASVFAYTHLILDEKFGWKNNPLERKLRGWTNLVQHRQRLLEKYF